MLHVKRFLLVMKVGPEAIISVIRRLESIVEKQAIRTAILEEHGKIWGSRSNQNVMTLYRKFCK
jgi:transposase